MLRGEKHLQCPRCPKTHESKFKTIEACLEHMAGRHYHNVWEASSSVVYRNWSRYVQLVAPGEMERLEMKIFTTPKVLGQSRNPINAPGTTPHRRRMNINTLFSIESIPLPPPPPPPQEVPLEQLSPLFNQQVMAELHQEQLMARQIAEEDWPMF